MEDIHREQSLKILADAEVAHLGVIDGDVPYVTPMSFVVVDETIYFRTKPGRRLSALESNPRVCIEVSRTTGPAWESVIVWGDATAVDDLETRTAVVTALLHKYRKNGDPLNASVSSSGLGKEPVVMAVAIDEVSGRSAGLGLDEYLRPGRL